MYLLNERGASVGSMRDTEEQLGEELRLKWNISKTLCYVFACRVFNRFASPYCLITVSLSGHYFSLNVKLDLWAGNFCKLYKLCNVTYGVHSYKRKFVPIILFTRMSITFLFHNASQYRCIRKMNVKCK